MKLWLYRHRRMVLSTYAALAGAVTLFLQLHQSGILP